MSSGPTRYHDHPGGDSVYIGIDLHKANAVITALDDDGQEVLTSRIANSREGWEEFHRTFPDGGKVVLEATLNHMGVVDLLEGWGFDVSVAHAKRVRAIASSKTKTDKIDSRILAKLLQADFVPKAHVPPKKIRQMRELIRYRIQLGRDAAQVKNRIHALLVKNWVSHDFSDLFGKAGTRFLEELELPPNSKEVLESLLRHLKVVKEEIASVQKSLARLSVDDEQVERLMQINGIDFYSAQIIINEISDVNRFPSYRQMASYAGIVPTVRNSAETVRHGHITKEGNRNFRWILVEAAIKAKTHDPNLQKAYDRIKKRRGGQIARVAVARRLLRIIFYMLRDKTDYRYTRTSTYAGKKARMLYLAQFRRDISKGSKEPQGHPLKPDPAVQPRGERINHQDSISEGTDRFS